MRGIMENGLYPVDGEAAEEDGEAAEEEEDAAEETESDDDDSEATPWSSDLSIFAFYFY